MANRTSADELADTIKFSSGNDDELDTELEDDVEPEDTDSDDEPSEDDEEELSPSVKAILKKNRDRVREVEKELKQLKKPKAEADSDEVAESTAKADKFRGLFVKSAARAALAEAGLQGNSDRFLRMLDMDAIDVDEDGKLDGLDDQIEDIKADFPDLFEAAPPRRRRSAGDGAPRTPATRAKSSAEALAQRLVG